MSPLYDHQIPSKRPAAKQIKLMRDFSGWFRSDLWHKKLIEYNRKTMKTWNHKNWKIYEMEIEQINRTFFYKDIDNRLKSFFLY